MTHHSLCWQGIGSGELSIYICILHGFIKELLMVYEVEMSNLKRASLGHNLRYDNIGLWGIKIYEILAYRLKPKQLPLELFKSLKLRLHEF